MDKDKEEQIVFYLIILFVALMLGISARIGALMAGCDNFTANIIFLSGTALGIALALMIIMVLEESLNWLLNKVFPSRFKKVEKLEKSEDI